MRFVITGSGRCGTKYMSLLLTAAGVPCGHEQAYGRSAALGESPDWGDRTADSSWMALGHLPVPEVPVVHLVRHPLAVVRSLVEVGYFGPNADNPVHDASRAICPAIYDEKTAADRALAMWLHWNSVALRYAELRIQIERFDLGQFRRLLAWSGNRTEQADSAYAATDERNRLERLRRIYHIHHEPIWDAHRPALRDEARDLAMQLGYDPDVMP